jgi:manganese/zinc/iron transport system permease protein
MTDQHMVLYGWVSLGVIAFIVVFYKELLTLSFDAPFAQTSGIANRLLECGCLCVIVLALIIGMRCAGVILVSAMLIAPAAAARQFTNHLSHMFVWAGFFGALSGFLGTYYSVILSSNLTGHYTVPTGPMIVLISGALALLALLFAPKRGLVIRYLRVARFRAACVQENLLKALWRLTHGGEIVVSLDVLVKKVGFPSLYTRFLLTRLMWQKACLKQGKKYALTPIGTRRGAHIVRLHRLWEAYLVYSLGLKVERVHKSAEEMEHILTPEFEQKLTQLLEDPKQDPHDQPIPEGGYVL